jgi:hypothetical protein
MEECMIIEYEIFRSKKGNEGLKRFDESENNKSIVECKECKKRYEIESNCGYMCVCPDCLKSCNDDFYNVPFNKFNIFWGEERDGFVEKRTNSVVKSHVVYNIYYTGGYRRIENPKNINEIYDILTNEVIHEIDENLKKIENDKNTMIEKFVKEFAEESHQIWLLDCGDISRYHDVVTISKEHSGKWVIYESRLYDKFSFTRDTEIFEEFSSVDDFKQWITRFVERYFEIFYTKNWPTHEGLPHIEEFGTVISCEKKDKTEDK